MKAILGFFLFSVACTLSAHAATVPASKPPQLTSPDQVPEGLANSDWSSIRAAYEAGRHRFFKQEDGSHVARNPGMGWKMKFDERGFTAQPEDGAWTWGLEVASSGTRSSGDVRLRVPLEATANRLSRQLTPAITEWFVNDARGLEQGWTLSAPAEIRLRVRGNLKPSVSLQSITFGGQLTYSGLKAWDATGKTVPTHFEATIEGFAVRYDDTGAQYPLTIDPIAQQAYLKASNTGAGDWFGWSVAISGDTVVVGAYLEDSNATGVNGNQTDDSASNAGAAYVFVRSGSSWVQQAYLKASNTELADGFGFSVAVSGDTAVIGANKEASNATGVGGNQADNSAIGSGAAYVFTRSGSTWTQQAYLKASNSETNDRFGISVAVSGDTVVIGADGEDSNATGVGGNQADNSALGSGAAYVFKRSGSTWVQQAYLKASNTGEYDLFGWSVAVSGDTVVIGAYGESSNATGVGGNQVDDIGFGSGAAYVFVRSGSTWVQQAYLKASNTGEYDRFGISVALSGDTVVIGADGERSNATAVGGNQADNSAIGSGAAYVCKRSGSTWTQQADLNASNTGAQDQFGWCVAVSGDTAVVGAYMEESKATGVNGNQTDNSVSNPGAAYVFVRSGSTWSQQAYLKASNTGAHDQFGISVAVSGDTVVIGAPLEDSSATGVNGTQADNGNNNYGSAYIFTGLGPVVTVTGIFPSIGSTAGGASVTIAGSGFTGATGVTFGGVAATNVTVIDANIITCTTPAGSVGAASVVVTAPGGSNAANTLFTYDVAPTVTAATPSSGSAAGGTSVTITGTGFTGATGVTFGVVMATGVTVVNDTTINCTTPAGSAGAVSVVVTTPGGSNAANTLFTYTGGEPLAALEAYLKASNTGGGDISRPGDSFGYSVAVSGDTAVIGAPGEASNATGVNGNQVDNSAPSSGAAYVFTRSGSTWTQQAYLKAGNTAAYRFGTSVALAGDTLVIGAPYEFNNGPYSGAAYVFTRSAGVWIQQAYLKASNTEVFDYFGQSVALSGDTVVIGAIGEASNATGVNGDQADNSAFQSGAAYVFSRSGSTWTQQAYLKASNTEAGDYFGVSVAVSDDIVVIGAGLESSNATGVGGNQADNSASYSGAAYIFSRSGSTWTQQAYLKASNTEAGDYFGVSVAVSGDTALIGALGEASSAIGVVGNQADNSALNSGAAYVFTRSGSTWTQQAYLKASNTGSDDYFGWSVSLSGDRAVIGAYSESSNAAGVGGNQADNSASFSGAAYVFSRCAGVWTQQAYLKASNTGADDNFGRSVAVSGDTVVSGAYKEDSNATGVGGNQADDSATDSGAAYTFRLPTVLTPAQVFDATLTTAGLSGPNAALNATPHGDGVANLLKYAFNMNLSGPDAATMPPSGNSGLPGITTQPNGASSIFRYEFLRRKNSGLIYTPQKSDELANPAAWVPLTDLPTVISIDATWERVIYEEPYDAATTPRCFGRVQVTLP